VPTILFLLLLFHVIYLLSLLLDVKKKEEFTKKKKKKKKIKQKFTKKKKGSNGNNALSMTRLHRHPPHINILQIYIYKKKSFYFSTCPYFLINGVELAGVKL
jgi:Na+-transporting methylmalonyl-CoA/oxaloacetate decarboxylase gamma subunit